MRAVLAAWTVVRESLDPGAAWRGSSIALDLEFRRVWLGGRAGRQAAGGRRDSVATVSHAWSGT